MLAAIGPFAIDTYLPAFPTIARSLATSDLHVQQTLTAYLAPFAFMTLWHGSISDALGRRIVVLASLLGFAAASAVCMFAPSIEILWLGRALQGITSGAGMVVGRAIVRDLLSGPEAQRLMARVAMIFAISPAIAPIIGGWIYVALGWRATFGFLLLFGLLLFVLCWRYLPETLPPESRHSLHPVKLGRAYLHACTHRQFLLLIAALSLNFGGFFLYVLAAPKFLIEHLGVSPQGFATLFVPTVLGMVIGSFLSGRLAGKVTPLATVSIAYAIMLSAATLNVLLNSLATPGVPQSIAPIPLYNIGMALAMPNLTLLGLDQLPQRGLAASCQSFAQSLTTSLAAAFFVPLLWGSTLTLALGMAGFLGLGLICFLAFASKPHATVPPG
ncbi:MAG: multidrug effflux MFS transporter [Sterolibacteriaceae bacterium]|uniref:Bcr/CflA family efflux transporter n=1 Tax=Candidatus Methylophosphatis roskildensis TaxID=2899263 RepID=A0A9D7E0I8_9PROT|nr:multidrug effflux MFS transporter [Candidatus Methylophosphatis roskildensis]